MRLEFVGVNTNKLHDELINANIFPHSVESSGGTTWVTVDDNQVEAVNAIVANHNPAPIPQSPTTEERLEATEAALLAMMEAMSGV